MFDGIRMANDMNPAKLNVSTVKGIFLTRKSIHGYFCLVGAMEKVSMDTFAGLNVPLLCHLGLGKVSMDSFPITPIR